MVNETHCPFCDVVTSNCFGKTNENHNDDCITLETRKC